MKFLHDYVRTILARGIYFFSQQEALSLLRLTSDQFRFQCYRLAKKKIIRRLFHNFFMIIPDEYSLLGSLPPSWAIDAIMKYKKQDYYVGLLSAAALYGATEQQPMSLQVITTKPIRSIDFPRGSIEFHVFKECSSSQKTEMVVHTGTVLVSSKEQTMVDLVRFYRVSGHLNTVTLVIKSLAESGNLFRFKRVIQAEKTNSVLQRLGYVLETLQLTQLAQIVEKNLAKRNLKYILMRPEFLKKSGAKSSRWKLILNDTLEPITDLPLAKKSSHCEGKANQQMKP
jgi:predicted transcriptional regulator of viral defense system